MNINPIAMFAFLLVALFGIITNSLIPVVIGLGGFIISIILRETKKLDAPPVVEVPVEVVPEPEPIVEKPKRTRTVKTNTNEWGSTAKQAPKKTTTGAKRGPKPKK